MYKIEIVEEHSETQESKKIRSVGDLMRTWRPSGGGGRVSFFTFRVKCLCLLMLCVINIGLDYYIFKCVDFFDFFISLFYKPTA